MVLPSLELQIYLPVGGSLHGQERSLYHNLAQSLASVEECDLHLKADLVSEGANSWALPARQ